MSYSDIWKTYDVDSLESPEDLPLPVAVIHDEASKLGVVVQIELFGPMDHAIYVETSAHRRTEMEQAEFVLDDEEIRTDIFVKRTAGMPVFRCCRCGENRVFEAIDSVGEDIEEVREYLFSDCFCGYCNHMWNKND